ncbi:MAG: ABC transporter substrate-binding protein [Bacillota bacterium]
MRKNKFLTVLVALMLVVALLGVVACGKKADTTGTDQTDTGKPAPTKTLKIGFIMPMSGPASLWGVGIKKDTEAYAAIINEDGGLKIGDEYYNVETFYADDQGTPDKAAPTANELINNDGVSAILGYWGIGLPTIASITTPAKVVTIFTKPMNYDPKTMPYAAFSLTDTYIGFTQLASILNAFPNTKHLGISADEVYYAAGETTVPQFKEILAEKGITYFEDTYPWGTLDYTTHIDKLHKAGVDTIFSWAAPEEEAMKQKEIYANKYQMAFAGAGTIPDLKSYIDMSGQDAAQGGLHPYNYPWDFKEIKVAPDVVTMAERIRDKHQEMLGEEMSYDGAFAYGLNSMIMYFQALQAAGTTDADAVMKQIDGGHFDLFTGSYDMGGLQTYGRNVMAPPTGPMGIVKGTKMELASESPAYIIP